MVEARKTNAKRRTSRSPPAKKPIKPKVNSKVVTRPHKPSYPYCYATEDKRLKAVETGNIDFSQKDPVLHHMLTNAEAMFTPKFVYTPSDWLVFRKERGQDIKLYRQGGPDISWHDPRRGSTIYLFIIDESISESMQEQFKIYCQAFYHGVNVKVVKPGSNIKEK